LARVTAHKLVEQVNRGEAFDEFVAARLDAMFVAAETGHRFEHPGIDVHAGVDHRMCNLSHARARRNLDIERALLELQRGRQHPHREHAKQHKERQAGRQESEQQGTHRREPWREKTGRIRRPD